MLVVRVRYRWIAAACAVILLLSCLPFSRFMASGAEEGVELPVVMYHSILNDPALAGDYVLSPQQLECDLRYIKECGYTPVLMEDLISYVNIPEAKLPPKPILITFDDGYYNNYLYAYPLMQKYQMKCVMSVVVRESEEYEEGSHQSPNYSPLSFSQMREMEGSGLVEIQNHSYDMHTYTAARAGAAKAPGESEEHYRAVLTEDTLRAQRVLKEQVGVVPTTYTYPFGKVSEQSVEILDELGFEATLSCEEGVNRIVKGGTLVRLKRYNRPTGKDSAAFFSKLLA